MSALHAWEGDVPRAGTSNLQGGPLGSVRYGKRGGVRTWMLSLATLAALAILVVVTLIKSLAPPAGAPPPTTGGGLGDSARAVPQDRPDILGTITLAPKLAGRLQEGSVLFVIARKSTGPPFAVKRIAAPRFPLSYRLGAEDVMMAGQAFDGEMRVSARVSQTGTAGPPQPGDLEGEHVASVRVGARHVDVVIDRVR